jgi:hypothetical protein
MQKIKFIKKLRLKEMKKRNKFYILVSSLILISCISKSSYFNDVSKTNCCGLDRRREILFEMKEVLVKELPSFKGVEGKGFYISDKCQLIGVSIFDISDTLNKEETLNEYVKFKENHIYHFFPPRLNISYSNIAILSDSKIKIFKALNCPKQGDNIEDVIKYIEDSLPLLENKKEILNRVANYREYGHYIKIDEQSEFICK